MQFSPMLVLHITAGSLALLSGTAAISFRKGSSRHALAGNLFVISMLCMAASGAYMAYMKPQMHNFFGGLLTIYLVATAWMTAKRRRMETSIFDWTALLVALAVGLSLLIYGVEAANSSAGSRGGVPAGMFFFLGSITLLSAAGDIRMLARGGISSSSRIVRHLWRMCFALFVATGSFFIGQQRVFPLWFRGTKLLFILGILPLPLLVFWLFRVLFTNRYKERLSLSSGDIQTLPSATP